MALKQELKDQGQFLFKYRSYLPLILLAIGVSIQYYQVYFNIFDDNNIIQTTLIKSSLWVGLFGLLIRIITVGYTPKNTSGRNQQKQVADELNTTGFYSLVRNPLYLGNYFMWLCCAMLTGNLAFSLIFSLVFWIFYERIVYTEEDFLTGKFGETYLKWSEKTPPFLPKTLKFVKPDYSFSWKKVVKKEKNGLFALFLIIYIFEVIKEQSFEIQETWITYGAISTGILYFILKYIKKYTSTFDEEGR